MFQREPIQDLQSTVAQWYREHGSPQTVADVEQAAEEIARAAGAAVVEVGIAEVAQNHQREANQLPCSCGHRAYFKENRPRDIATLFGAVSVKRAYYRCPSCGRSQIPWDTEQGLNQRSFTPRVCCRR